MVDVPNNSNRDTSTHPDDGRAAPRWPWLVGVGALIAIVVVALLLWGGQLNERLAESLRGDVSGIGLYVAVYLAGVAISITPCVYPIIPITISFIGARQPQSRLKSFLLSLAYVVGMAAAYFVIGASIAAAAAGGKMVFFGEHQNNPWLGFAVANVLVFFGLNMMGAFELRLPSFLTKQRTGAAQKKGGYVGAFLVGGASALVVGSCTGAAIAAMIGIIVKGATPDNVVWASARGGLILFVFAMGLGTLVLLVGTFSGLLTSLPKPGGWMDLVKKGFGLVMAAIGGLFLVSMAQNTDFPLLWKAPWVDRFAGTWGLILLVAIFAAAVWLAAWLGFLLPRRKGASAGVKAVTIVAAAVLILAAEYVVIGVAQHSMELRFVADLFATSA
jgi:thiol:disulfide interchange protein DsbD